MFAKYIAKPRSIWFLEESAPAIFPSRTQAPEQFSLLNTQVRKDHHHSILHHCVALSVLSQPRQRLLKKSLESWWFEHGQSIEYCCLSFSLPESKWVTRQPQALAMLLGCCSQQKPKNKSCSNWCAVGNLSRAQHFRSHLDYLDKGTNLAPP